MRLFDGVCSSAALSGAFGYCVRQDELLFFSPCSAPPAGSLARINASSVLARAGPLILLFEPRSDNKWDMSVLTSSAERKYLSAIRRPSLPFNDNHFPLNDRVYLALDDGFSGEEPWVLYYNTLLLTRVSDLAPGAASSRPRFALVQNSLLFFVATTPAAGREIYVADSADATRLVRDIYPGKESSFPGEFFLYADRVMFVANDGNSFKLWATDGSFQNTISFSPSGGTVWLGLFLVLIAL